MPPIRKSLSLAAFLALGAPALAQEPELVDELGGGDDLIELMVDLETQLNQTVVSSTKTAQRATQAPAVITVITAEEIRARGYLSLAEVLRVVPGFYDVHDLATHNVGVRGVNGGARASGSILKLMIDGHPVDFRPTTGNFFGEELIPLPAVERIEVIRGPASALYGANAFLGVVNVITRKGASVDGAKVTGYGGTIRSNPGGGGGLMIGGGNDTVDVLVAGQFLFWDRSGLSLPDTSPVLENESSPLREAGTSRGDISRPRSLFFKVSTSALAAGRLTLSGSVQNPETGGEFQDFAPLTHRTRLSSLNQNYRLLYEAEPSDAVGLAFSAAYLNAQPTPLERLDIGRPDVELLRRIGASGVLLTAEARVQAASALQLIQGVDLALEEHTVQSFDQRLRTDVLALDGSVLRRAGTILPAQASAEEASFTNLGAFVQAMFQANDSVGLVAGARVDVHNIYGVNPSGRAGIVFAPQEKAYSAKLLYGSAFKAPSAVQLYTQPMKVLDVRGNPLLKPQTAHTFEAVGGYALAEGRGELSINAFATAVQDRVEFVQRGLYLRAQNVANEWVVGGEAEARLNWGRALSTRLALGVARTVDRSTDSALEGLPETTNPLFPSVQAHLLVDWHLPFLGLRLSPEVSFIGPRGASQPNTLELGTPYTLPPYLFTAVALSAAPFELFSERETRLAIRATNLLNTPYADPGFGGIDVPAQGLTAFLTLTQSL